MTDYVRQGFARRRRPWDPADLPGWWDLAVWTAVLLIIGALAASVVLDLVGREPERPARSPRRYAVQTLNPYAENAGPSSLPSSPGAQNPATPDDFSASAAVRVPLTTGGRRSFRRAPATWPWPRPRPRRSATGRGPDGRYRAPVQGAPHPLGTVQDGITVADPAATGTGSYVFSAMIRHDAGARAYLVRITVERTPRGYAIRLTG